MGVRGGLQYGATRVPIPPAMSAIVPEEAQSSSGTQASDSP